MKVNTRNYVTTIAISSRGNYHIADDDDLALRPLCGVFSPIFA